MPSLAIMKPGVSPDLHFIRMFVAANIRNVIQITFEAGKFDVAAIGPGRFNTGTNYAWTKSPVLQLALTSVDRQLMDSEVCR